ncbi:MAG: type II toxin-antitoxin system VapC family toxin [Planctomycetes bacterium]|nr:type II toxin-antitoxin system VapC family toxin [Planctomycetota bacterium]
MIYLDTGCLLKLYYPEPDSPAVVRAVSGQLIALVPVHELEIANALELKLFRKEARPSQTRATHALVEQDVRAGILHRPPVNWEEALRDATTLARAHSRALGCRSLDILHCAIARHLAAKTFITTDRRQRRLATAIGLACPAL